ncbi:MAG: glycoside hydrolase family 127 protein [Coprobacter sp.]|nr:glycoside hydrolase family 127 protein [Coprobacter sp.]
MKHILATLLLITAIVPWCRSQQLHSGYPITPVAFTDVKITDHFWKDRLQANREVTIPLAFEKCEETGRYDNFVKAAHPDTSYKVEGFSFDDTDVYKIIEGASYSLQTFPDKRLSQYIDSVLDIVAGAQESDGYLYTARSMNPTHPHAWAGATRWSAVEHLSHEFYNLGHMIEGAVAHYQATGSRKFLDIAIRYADCVCREIGDREGQTVAVPGHQIAEMALAKLYLVTGDKKYLEQAKFFLDKRGYTSRKDKYSQAHRPVIEQDEAVGHAVRAVYMYSGMADVAALTGDSSYIQAIDRIWDNIVNHKLYITGGIGATYSGEAFGRNYELPNLTSYCETCASIGHVYMNYRMFLLHGDAKYYDILERTLYNSLIAGISLDGGKFFYPNPLASDGRFERQSWFGCACCPSNVCRFIPSLPGYVYATRDDSLYVNLFVANSSTLKLGGKKVEITQSGNYPWSGDMAITISPQKRQSFTLKIRIPGWVQNTPLPGDLYSYIDDKHTSYTIKLNGQPIEGDLHNGYFTITRAWKKGDKVEVSLDMTPRLVAANHKVAADRGRIAVERGPIVYCAEWCDNDVKITNILLSKKPIFDESYKADKLHGIIELQTNDVQVLNYDATGKLHVQDTSLILIPYYSWAHRGKGHMSVWLPTELYSVELTRPKEDILQNNGFFKQE